MINDEFADVTFALFALKAKGEPQRLLVRDAETLRQQLLHVPGVKKVNIIGEQAERIYISFSHERLATMGLSPQDIFNALNSQNALTRRVPLRLAARRSLSASMALSMNCRRSAIRHLSLRVKRSSCPTWQRLNEVMKILPLCRFVTSMNRRCCWGL
jgi:predicted DNA-binding transcriptional regulator YafY